MLHVIRATFGAKKDFFMWFLAKKSSVWYSGWGMYEHMEILQGADGLHKATSVGLLVVTVGSNRLYRMLRHIPELLLSSASVTDSWSHPHWAILVDLQDRQKRSLQPPCLVVLDIDLICLITGTSSSKQIHFVWTRANNFELLVQKMGLLPIFLPLPWLTSELNYPILTSAYRCTGLLEASFSPLFQQRFWQCYLDCFLLLQKCTTSSSKFLG